jgi:phosphoribosylaminoimidazole-succinocarboxamide synthase
MPVSEDLIRSQLKNTLQTSDLPRLGTKYQGKVRDNYTSEKTGVRTIISTDRLSAFDRVITTIPFKGQLLNQMSVFWFDKTKNIAKNHIIDVPDPNVVRVHNCRGFPVEMIVRAYITGSAWRAYEKGNDVCGIEFPRNLKKNQKLPELIITPSTKAAVGQHDENISRKQIIDRRLIPETQYKELEEKTLKMFEFASNYCAKQNLILVDCKFEFGVTQKNEIVVIDEIFTPDASRFWISNTYNSKFSSGQEPDILDKEFFRAWLMKERNFSGDGPIPDVPDNIKVEFVKRYVQSYEMITGKSFVPLIKGNIVDRIKANLKIS